MVVMDGTSVGDPAETVGSSREALRMEVLRSVVAQQCLDVGWHGITESSLASLSDVLDRYLKSMTQKIASYADLAGRNQATVDDFRLALCDVEPSTTLKDLSSFCTNIRDSPLDSDLQYPLQIESDMFKATKTYGLHMAKSIVLDNGGISTSDAPPTLVNGLSRPDWMDEDMIFPPIEDSLLGSPVLKNVSHDEEPRTSAVIADIIIGDDDEEELAAPSLGALQSANLFARSPPTKLAGTTVAPRQLKSVSMINGSIVSTLVAKAPESRLPVEPKLLKPVIEKFPASLVPVVPKRKKSPSKKERHSSQPPTKKQKKVAEPIKVEPVVPPQEALKIRIKPPKPKKPRKQKSDGVSPGTQSDLLFVPPLRVLDVKPDIFEVPQLPPPPPPRAEAQEVSKSLTIKLKPLSAEAWKKDKKERKRKPETELPVMQETEKKEREKKEKDHNHQKRPKEHSKKEGRERSRPEEPTREKEKISEMVFPILESPKPKKSIEQSIDFLIEKQQIKHVAPEVPAFRGFDGRFQPKELPQHLPASVEMAPFEPVRKKSSKSEKREKEKEREKERERIKSREELVMQFENRNKETEKARENDRIKDLSSLITSKGKHGDPNRARSSASNWGKDVDVPGERDDGTKGRERIKSKEIFVPESPPKLPLIPERKTPKVSTPSHPPIPKLTLKVGGKDIHVIKGASTLSVRPRSPPPLPNFPAQNMGFPAPTKKLSLPVMVSEVHRQLPVPSFDAQASAPLDLSMGSRSVKKAAEVVQVAPVPMKKEKVRHSDAPPRQTHAPQPKAQPPPPPFPSSPVKIEVPRVATPPPPPPVFGKSAVPEYVATEMQVQVAAQTTLDPKWICPSCKKAEDGNDSNNMVACDQCDFWYHWNCVGLLAEPTVDKWFCPNCLGKQMNKSKKKKKHG